MVWVVAAAAMVAGPVRAISYDPFRDLTCSIGCGPNPWAVVNLDANLHHWLSYPALAVPVLLAVAALLGRDLALALLALSMGLVAALGAGLLLSGTVIGACLALVVGADAGRVLASRARVRDLARGPGVEHRCRGDVAARAGPAGTPGHLHPAWPPTR